MNVLRIMLRHAGYYIIVLALISLFAGAYFREWLITLCGAALSVSMFSAIAELLLGDSIGEGAQRVSVWCLRGTAITTAIVIIARFGIDNILKLFA